MSHLTQPNRVVHFPYSYTVKVKCGNGDVIENEYADIYTYEVEPVITRLPNGKLVESWRPIPIDRMSEDEVGEYMRFYKWASEHAHESKRLGQLEALIEFRADAIYIAQDHITKGIDVEYWEKVLQEARGQQNLEMQQAIARAKEYPIMELVRRYGHEPRLGYICCPFHGERTGSLKIYTNNNSWYCYGCNKGGSTIDFVMQSSGLDFKEAVEYLI